MVHQAGSGAGHPKSAATDGYGDQEQLERAEKGQGWAQPWITKAHLVKSQMLNDLKRGSPALLMKLAYLVRNDRMRDEIAN